MKAIALTGCGAVLVVFVLMNAVGADVPAWLGPLSTLALVALLWQLRSVFAVFFPPRRRR